MKNRYLNLLPVIVLPVVEKCEKKEKFCFEFCGSLVCPDFRTPTARELPYGWKVTLGTLLLPLKFEPLPGKLVELFRFEVGDFRFFVGFPPF